LSKLTVVRTLSYPFLPPNINVRMFSLAS
jgi:hypothetical protein